MGLGKKKILSQGASGVTPTDNFAPKLYSGGSAGQVISGVGFQPDLIIGKRRDSAEHWWVNDVARSGKSLFLNLADAEISFQYTTPNSDGFVVNATGGVHNTGNLVAYCFKGGGAAASNGSGSITSQVSANTEAGFSVVKYTGTGSAATVGHGISTPELIIIKRLNFGTDWIVYHKDLKSNGYDGYLSINNNYGEQNAGALQWNSTNPTNTVFSVGTSISGFQPVQTNNNGSPYIAYCFHSVPDYQKVGFYNGSSSTVTITTGFQPRFLIIKRSNGGNDWILYDTVRSGGTSMDDYLIPNSNSAEYANSSLVVNATSTGFTIASGLWAGMNEAGGKYIYLAIA
jgi:hypothetical protein